MAYNIKPLLCPFKSDSYKISAEWEDGVCRLSFVNLTKKPIFPKKIIVFDSAMPFPADTPIYGEGYNKLCQYGGTVGNVTMTATLGDLGHYKLDAPKDFGQVYNLLIMMPQNEDTALIGFTSCNRFSGEFWLNSERLQVVLNLEGIEVGAGEELELESLFAAYGVREPLLEQLAGEIQKNHPILLPEEIPTGWCSWLVYGPSVTAQNIYDNMEAIKKQKLALKYIQIDDGYQTHMGDWLTEAKTFDGGIKKLCLDIKAQGFEPAIWVAPFIAEEKSEVFQSHQDWFVKDENGNPLASDKISFGGWRCGPWYMLDGTNPEARHHLTHVFKTMRREWQVKYFKLDANMWGALPFGTRFEKNKTCVEAYRMGMKAILDGAGEDSFLLGCNAPMWPSIGTVHGMRITNDNSRCFDTFKELAKTCFPRNWQHNRLWVNDPDTVLLCNRNQNLLDPAGIESLNSTLTHEDFLFNATYTLASGGMVLSSDDITGFTEQNCKDLKKLLPAVKGSAVFDDLNFNVGRIKLENEQIICIFNYGDTHSLIQVVIDKPSEFINFWTDESLDNKAAENCILSLKPHSSMALRAKPIKQIMPDVELSPRDSMKTICEKAVSVRPTPNQLTWQKMEFVAFIHFGVNTFTNREWGDGTESPEIFNPTDFDANQIVSVIKEAGMKAVILTCKHHDGFCLWPSKYTEHSVKSSPWKGGKGDVVREISDACKRYGLKFGVYLSPWDRHDSRYGDSPTYNEYYLNQLTELLTEYGEVFDLWLDGACAEGPNGKKQTYDWRAIFEKVRLLQPNATITGVAPDARWCGNEAGICRESEWSVVPIVGTDALPPEKSDKTAVAVTRHNLGDDEGKNSLCCDEDLGSIEVLKKHAKNGDRLYWYPAQVNLSIRPGWFYHEYEDESVHPLEKLVNVYLNSVGGNSQLLLNLPPDKTGQLHKNDVTRLKELGKFISQTFNKNLIYAVGCATDNEYVLSAHGTYNLLMLGEDISRGQRVESFKVYTGTEEKWELVYSGTTIGYKKLIRLKKQEDGEIKVLVTSSRDIPQIRDFGIYLMPDLSNKANIARAADGKVSVDLPLGGVVTVTANGITTTSEFGISPKAFKITNYSESEIESYRLEQIFSSDENRYAKLPCSDGLPVIEFDMGKEYTIKGLRYMPVTSGFDANLNICAYSIFGSLDGISFFPITVDGELSNIYHNPILFKLPFDSEVTARYIRFEVKNSLNKAWLTIGEISLLAN